MQRSSFPCPQGVDQYFFLNAVSKMYRLGGETDSAIR